MADMDVYVLDTSVISSFYAVDWLGSIASWRPQRELIAPERVWSEFEAYFDADQPNWLDLQKPDLEQPEVKAQGALSVTDWACIVLAEEKEQACIVTNDRAIIDTADRRSLMYQWGTTFLLHTFYKCYVTKQDLKNGLKSYANDLGLDQDVRQEVRSAEK